MSASAPGPPPRGGDVRPLRGIPRSRAFWELKAEQMMNRIFDPEEPIDLDVEVTPAPQSHPGGVSAAPLPAGEDVESGPKAAPAGSAANSRRPVAAVAPSRSRSAAPRRSGSRLASAAAPRPAGRSDDRLLLIGALCGVCVVSVAGSLLYFGYWNRLQQNLAQERNLLLVERLRSLGPANPAPGIGPEPATPVLPPPAGASQAAVPGADGLPPPPPEEPWIEQLATLPQTSGAPSRLLQVPLTPGVVSAPARPAASPPRPPAPLPQLVGVVAGGGRASAAIFLVGGTSMSVASGEMIGSSGWRLRSAEGEIALIERGGEVRQVSIVSGNGF